MLNDVLLKADAELRGRINKTLEFPIIVIDTGSLFHLEYLGISEKTVSI